jgi:ribonuclease HI
MKRAKLHADGCSLGNPGPAGIGVRVEVGGEVREIAEGIGTATNNVAEYRALIRGLEEAKRLGAEEVEAYADSELLVRQVSGRYRVKNPGLRPLYERLMGLAGEFRRFRLSHVPREENAVADRLSKQGAKPDGGRPQGGTTRHGGAASESGMNENAGAGPDTGAGARQGGLF